MDMRVHMYIYVCVHICTPRNGEPTHPHCTYMHCIYVCIYTPLLTHKHKQGEQETPHERRDEFMCVRVHTFITYMFTSTHHYWHTNTAKGSKGNLNNRSMICIHLHTITDTTTQARRDPSQVARCIHVFTCTCTNMYAYIYAPILKQKHRQRQWPLTRRVLDLCVYMYTYIFSHVNTLCLSMCAYVYVYILARTHTILIYVCICIRINSHT